MLGALKTGHWPIFLLSSISSMANLYLPIFLARILSAEAMGIYKLFFLHMAAVPFLFLAGGPLHSVYYWVGRDEKSKTPYIQQSFILVLILSVLILAAGLPFNATIANMTSMKNEYVSLMLFAAFLSVPTSFYSHTKIALGATVSGSLFDTLFEVVKVAAFILIAWKTKDVGLLFFAFCVIFSLKFIISLPLKIKENFLSLKPNPEKLSQIFTYCLPISLAGLVTFFLDKMDQFVLASRLTPENFAFYSMGCLIVPPLYMLEMSVAKVLVPTLSRSWVSKDPSAISHFRKAVKDSAFLVVPSFFGLFLFSGPIIRILYSDKFLESAIYLKCFAISYLFMMIPYDAVPRATGKTAWIFKLTITVGVVSFLAVLLASSYLGAVETLIVALLFKFIARVVGLLYSAKIMSWNPAEMIPWKALFVFFLASIIPSALSIAAKNHFPSDIWWFLVCGPLFALIYFAFTLAPKHLEAARAK